MTRAQYETLSAASLKDIAKSRGIKGSYALKKQQLIEAMLELDAKIEAEAKAAKQAAEEKTAREAAAAREKTADEAASAAEEKPVRRTASRKAGTAREKAPAAGRKPAGRPGRKSVKEAPAPAEEKAVPVPERPVPAPEKSAQEAGTPAAGEAAPKRRTRIVRKTVAKAVPKAAPAEENETPAAQPSVTEDAEGVRTQPAAEAEKPVPERREQPRVRGILEVMQDGFGFIRSENFLPGDNDVYVSPSQIRRFHLKTGDMVCGTTRDRAQGEKFGALIYVETINDLPADQMRNRMVFEHMTPVFPYERIRLERPGGTVSSRIVDLICPIGKGQRGMIVSPPKAGKTTLLKDIAKSILYKDPDANVIILLIDERPEEVTDMKESVHGKNVEIIYSTFDELPEHHKRVSEMVIERAKRLVELKQDVVILLDSITRLARAYNVLVPQSGRTLSGGLDPTALHMPKRFFGAARKMREGGSLTILATALVDTGSKMDDVVYEEFKGTGNMELILDRKLQERRIFPAIDITKSSTRREDLLLSKDELEAVNMMRRSMGGVRAEESTEAILNMFTRLQSNALIVQAILQRKLF